MTSYLWHEKDAICDLLIGRRVVSVKKGAWESGELTLDDGRTLIVDDSNLDCCAHYVVTVLNEVDNVITAVTFEDEEDDHYSIFVFADNERINLVTLEGTDGSGYYGTGYTIHVREAK